MNQYFGVILFIVLPPQLFAVEYNAATKAVVNMSSPVAGHPISHATDLNLNTYFQTDVNILNTDTRPWVLFDLTRNVNIEKIIFWLASDDDQKLPRIFLFVRYTNAVNYNSDIFCQIESPVRNEMYNCPLNNNLTPRNGRYALIWNEEAKPLRLSEVAIVTEDIDFVVTTLGHVNQSNVFENQPASNAIDGNVDTCIHTAVANAGIERTKAGWWRVDMLQEYNINAVELNDIKAQDFYKGNYSVYVSASDPINNGNIAVIGENLCLNFNQNTSVFNSYFRLNCSRPIKGRYLAIVRNSDYRPDALNFCEIKIHSLHNFEILKLLTPVNISATSLMSSTSIITSISTFKMISTPLSSTPSTTTRNIVLTDIEQISSLKNATQNYTHSPREQYSASMAIDGEPNSCSFTALDIVDEFKRQTSPGWWKVDLGQACEVHYLMINDNKSTNPGYFDIFVEKKEKSTDCDSALIPLLCVHG